MKHTIGPVTMSFTKIDPDTVELCPFVFKDKMCGYTGPHGSCQKTFLACRLNSNTDRFGGRIK